ncbi:hypothetical protein MHEI_15750 [Mycobacterium heidelbergense]|nr:hypothetical protein MHEI_15750 [Mycobacterium heidelbergense]
MLDADAVRGVQQRPIEAMQPAPVLAVAHPHDRIHHRGRHGGGDDGDGPRAGHRITDTSIAAAPVRRAVILA